MVTRVLGGAARSVLSPDAYAALDLFVMELRLSRAHSRTVRALRSRNLGANLRLNLGYGTLPKSGWMNIDIFKGAEVRLDLRRPLPFADSSAAVIYGEHVFEHFAFPTEARSLLRECFRVLAPSGVLDLVVPDTEEILQAYVARDEEHFRRSKALWHPAWCRSPMDQVNYHFRQDGEHRWAWDFESLERELREAGFVEVRRRGFDRELDSPERSVGNLAVIAKRPPGGSPFRDVVDAEAEGSASDAVGVHPQPGMRSPATWASSGPAQRDLSPIMGSDGIENGR